MMRHELHYLERDEIVIYCDCGLGMVVGQKSSIKNHFAERPHHLKGTTLHILTERVNKYKSRLPHEVVCYIGVVGRVDRECMVPR